MPLPADRPAPRSAKVPAFRAAPSECQGRMTSLYLTSPHLNIALKARLCTGYERIPHTPSSYLTHRHQMGAKTDRYQLREVAPVV